MESPRWCWTSSLSLLTASSECSYYMVLCVKSLLYHKWPVGMLFWPIFEVGMSYLSHDIALFLTYTNKRYRLAANL